MNDAHLFNAAREISLESDYSGSSKVKVGCVIAYKGAILAKGHNTDKTHSAQEKYNRWRYNNSSEHYLAAKAHAEIMALNKVKYLDIDWKKVHVYVYREFKSGRPAMARPCPACLQMIKFLGIQHIHYTTNDGYAHEKLN